MHNFSLQLLQARVNEKKNGLVLRQNKKRDSLIISYVFTFTVAKPYLSDLRVLNTL